MYFETLIVFVTLINHDISRLRIDLLNNIQYIILHFNFCLFFPLAEFHLFLI